MKTAMHISHDSHKKEWVLKETRWNNRVREQREILRDPSLSIVKAHLMAYEKSSKAGV